MSRELLQLAEALASEKNVDAEVVFSALEFALSTAAKKKTGREHMDVRVEIDRDSGEYRTDYLPEGEWFVQNAERLYNPWQGRDVPDSYKFAVDAIQTERVNKVAQDHLDSGAFAMGNPDTIIEVMKKYQDAGVDQVLCFLQPGRLEHTRIMDSIKLIGKHVIPHFL